MQLAAPPLSGPASGFGSATLGEAPGHRAPRNVAIDVLRALAVLMVMGRHMTPPCLSSGLGCSIMNLWWQGGWAGVDLFFVLSGFLVGGLLIREYQREQRVSLGRFYLRRGLKIWPAFYVLLALYGAFEYRFGATFSWRGVLLEAMYLQNYVGSMWNHTWSLAVEEHFYLFLGLLMTALAGRRRMSYLVPATILLLAACLAMRVLTFRAGHFTGYPTHLRMDSLMFGVLLSYFYHWHPHKLKTLVRRFELPILITSFALLVPLVFYGFNSAYFSTIGYSVNYLAFGGILLVAVVRSEDFEKSRILRGIAVVGADTYSIYLWHMFAKRALSFARKNAGVPIPYPLELVAFIALSVIIGVGMARLVERPVLRLRDSIVPSRSGALA